MFDQVIELDKWLFRNINSVYTNSVLDQFFPVWRESITWVPLYFFLLLFVLINFKSKGWVWLLLILLLPSLTDILSSQVIKDWIQRPRPCQDNTVDFTVRLLLNRCPKSFSFTSSHATNHFGAAVFIFLTLKKFIGKYRWLFIFWAATISYGQVYVGVHFPLDIIGGAIVGTLSGWLGYLLFKKINKVYPPSVLTL